MRELINTLTQQPGLTILLSVIFCLLALICTRTLLGDLLKMHRSKTAVKKLKSNILFRRSFCSTMFGTIAFTQKDSATE